MTDHDAQQLLELIHRYATEYGDFDGAMLVLDLVDDLALSMDRTTNRADELRRHIHAAAGA